MSEPFLSEIKIMSFNFPPKGWALCNGQLLPINQNQALFALLGTNYGGNGQTNFALPNLRGRVPIGADLGGSGSHQLAEAAGSTSVTINIQQLPTHTHFVNATSAIPPATAQNAAPGNAKVFAQGNASLQGGQTAQVSIYGTANSLTTLAPNAVSNVGGSQPHNNMMPYLVLNFCIALQGIFPSQN
jgi:microcystin-dependent protein